jgi:hypothetical protein
MQATSPQEDIDSLLLFALTAERLNGWHTRGLWVSDARAGEVANVWLARQNLSLPVSVKKRLLVLSDEFSRYLEKTLSHEAALHIAHEMMEALDRRYQSATAIRMLEECDRLLQENSPDAE